MKNKELDLLAMKLWSVGRKVRGQIPGGARNLPNHWDSCDDHIKKPFMAIARYVNKNFKRKGHD